MARNEEKHYGLLNRLILQKQKEDEEKKNPRRPKLDYLDNPEEIKKWLPSIKRDIEFYLKKSMVTCYSDEHVEECKLKVNRLESEYKAFVWKFKQLTPGKNHDIPWKSRPYKRKISEEIVTQPHHQHGFMPISTPILDKDIIIDETPSEIIKETPLMNMPLSFVSPRKKFCDANSSLMHRSPSNSSSFRNFNTSVCKSNRNAFTTLVSYSFSSDEDDV